MSISDSTSKITPDADTGFERNPYNNFNSNVKIILQILPLKLFSSRIGHPDKFKPVYFTRFIPALIAPAKSDIGLLLIYPLRPEHI